MSTLPALGKTIKVYLVDGMASGVLTAEIMNWTGKLVVAPRSQLSKLASRDDAKRAGVYFLVGDDPEFPARERVYIGESDDVFARLATHERDDRKDFWTRTALVTSKDANLTKSHTLYLESRLIRLATDAGRAIVDNGTAPEKFLPESDTADMEYFLAQLQLVLPVLGFTFLQQKPTVADVPGDSERPDTSPEFALQVASTSARAREVNGEFVVLSGSLARRQESDSLSTGYRVLRQTLFQESKFKDSSDPEHFEFAEDVAFSSPSGAAVAVLGMSINGRTTWKIANTGQTYAEWQEEKVAEASFHEADDSDEEAPAETETRVLERLGGGDAVAGGGRARCHRLKDGRVIHIKRSRLHERHQAYWYGVTPSSHDQVKVCGCSHYVFVLGASGFVVVPIEVVDGFLATAYTTRNSDGSIRHYHVHIAPPPTPHLKGYGNAPDIAVSGEFCQDGLTESDSQ